MLLTTIKSRLCTNLTFGKPKTATNTQLLAPMIASIAFVVELTLIPTTFAAVQDQFNLQLDGISLYLNVYSIAVVAGVLVCGQIADEYPMQSTFAIGTALFSLGSLASMISESFSFFLLGRFLQGFGAGLFLPTIPIFFASVAKKKPGKTMITLGAISGYVSAFTPLAYSYFFDESNWRLPFACLMGLGLLAMMSTGLTYSCARKDVLKLPSRSRALLIMSSRLIAIFSYIFCTYGAVMYGFLHLPTWIISGEFNTAEVGAALTLVWLSYSTVSLLLRVIVESQWLVFVLISGPIAIAASILLLSFYPSVTTTISSTLLLGIGLACSNSPSTQIVLRFTPSELKAFSSSLDIICARLGGVLTTTIAVLLPGPFQTPLVVALLVGAIVAIWLIRNQLAQPKKTEALEVCKR